MCQWKFLVFRYSANTSARMAFIAPVMSRVAAAFRSVGVANGALRRRTSSCLVAVAGFFIGMDPCCEAGAGLVRRPADDSNSERCQQAAAAVGVRTFR